MTWTLWTATRRTPEFREPRRCAGCGQPIVAVRPNQRRCPACQTLRDRAIMRRSQQRRRTP